MLGGVPQIGRAETGHDDFGLFTLRRSDVLMKDRSNESVTCAEFSILHGACHPDIL